MRIRTLILIIIIGLVVTPVFQSPVIAVIDGPCVNCHTMHNSQNGTSMNFNNSANPNELLLRADCFGCHARGISQNIDPITGAPQVYHTGGTDLAGGNFAYINGNNDSKVHNVIELNNQDDILNGPPGSVNQAGHDNIVNDTNFTCAGENGCHGRRLPDGGSGAPALKGAHHGNVAGKCDTADTVENSYRFLLAVKGLEDSDWQATVSATDHNEYYGSDPPPAYNCFAVSCHIGDPYIVSINNSISGFCGTCHGNFHGTIGGTGSGTTDGIGIGGSSSPFKRHPSDITLPTSGEYVNYTSYNLGAPVARATVPDTASNVVQPGSDLVMCLSCHAAHGTDYPDILRWDYTTMIAGGGGSDGCLACHTQKK
jgi:hypothetical protein